MSPEEAVAALDAIAPDAPTGGDPDGNHGEADKILLAAVHPDVAAAYERLVERSRWWATA